MQSQVLAVLHWDRRSRPPFLLDRRSNALKINQVPPTLFSSYNTWLSTQKLENWTFWVGYEGRPFRTGFPEPFYFKSVLTFWHFQTNFVTFNLVTPNFVAPKLMINAIKGMKKIQKNIHRKIPIPFEINGHDPWTGYSLFFLPSKLTIYLWPSSYLDHGGLKSPLETSY